MPTETMNDVESEALGSRHGIAGCLAGQGAFRGQRTFGWRKRAMQARYMNWAIDSLDMNQL